MLKNKLILGIIISLFSNFAFAQPSNTCLEAADKLIEINRIDNLLKSQTDMMTNYLARNLELLDDEKQDLNKLMTDILDIKSLKQDLVIAYCNTFTEDEINEMIAFNQTPLGKKYLISYQNYSIS